jgi:hypothetical protein
MYLTLIIFSADHEPRVPIILPPDESKDERAELKTDGDDIANDEYD